MNVERSVPLSDLVIQFELEPVAGSMVDFETIALTTSDLNRPGLQLAGYMQYFVSDRIQVVGRTEEAYLSDLHPDLRDDRLDAFFGLGFPAMVVTSNLPVSAELVRAARVSGIPVFRTAVGTSQFSSAAHSWLSERLAPWTQIHADFLDVYGEGVLLTGESGVGKSELALELVRRGHRMIADDAVVVRRVADSYLLANAPEISRDFIEVRGVGIVNIRRLYGVGAVKREGRIDLAIRLEHAKPGRHYERLGLDDHTTELLGLPVPSLTIPVMPGRNLAVVVEAAAMNHRQRQLGYNAAAVLDERVLRHTQRAARSVADPRRPLGA